MLVTMVLLTEYSSNSVCVCTREGGECKNVGWVAQSSTFMADTRHCSLGTCLLFPDTPEQWKSDVLSDIFCLMEHEGSPPVHGAGR